MKSCSIIEGTTLQFNGSTILSSTQRVNASFSFLNGTKVSVDAESIAVNTVVQIKLPFLSASVSDVRLNGGAKTFSIISDSIISIDGTPGTPLPVEHTSLDELLPMKFTVRQNFPNPFNPATTIEFSIPSSGRVKLKIFSLLGEEMRTLIDRDYPSGAVHRYELNDGTLPSGTYFYQIEYEHQRIAKKMILLK